MSASPDGSVTTWLEGLKAGDPAAAKPLWERYFQRLVAIARSHLKTVSRAAADEEDVALSAFDSFCRAAAQGRFPRLDDRDDLWHILLVITSRKAAGLIRRESRQKRGGRAARAGEDALASVAGGEPPPGFVAEVTEECRRLLGLLGDGQLRQVAIWKMEGYTNAEIARLLDRSVPTVERKLAAIRAVWEREVNP
jgi:DNA-directed RNA polymerase specialized sigma24 family protein